MVWKTDDKQSRRQFLGTGFVYRPKQVDIFVKLLRCLIPVDMAVFSGSWCHFIWTDESVYIENYTPHKKHGSNLHFSLAANILQSFCSLK